MEKVILKLSELPDDVEVSREYSHTTYTVAELKREITELGEPHHEGKDWAVIDRKTFKPCAETMIETYIDSLADEMYEGWDDSAHSFFNSDLIDNVQELLTKAMPFGMEYWTYGKDVEIDIFPSVVESHV